MSEKQVALIVLDGWGYSEEKENNAIYSSQKPYFDSIWKKYPHNLLMASEEYVGLPKGQPGNSEIGHTTIGAGQVIDTDLVKIKKMIKDGDFHQNKIFEKTFNHVKNNDSTLHIMGLVGEGGVHSHQSHLIELINLIKKNNLEKVALHLFTDGRDSGPYDCVESIKVIQEKCNDNIFISTISGRYYAMDRDNNFDRLEKFTKFLDEDYSSDTVEDWESEIKKQYEQDKTDEHLEPFVLSKSSISENDAVIITNFRSDRVRMLTSKLLEQKERKNLQISTFTEYSKDFDVDVIFPREEIKTTLAKEISQAGLTQTHIAETEKFPHATFFLNGGVEEPYRGEEHVLLNSRKDVATHDLAPEMKAKEIADKVIESIERDDNFIFVNFANPDMVGHSANVPAIIESIEFLDKQLERVVNKIIENGGVAIVTADHGNAELNIDPVTGEKHTAHTINPVPFIITKEGISVEKGGLSDIAPTVLKMFEIKKPDSMSGNNLIVG
jgi:2,3-bisphosphoglycerate-independent phosphoglycerate mutase